MGADRPHRAGRGSAGVAFRGADRSRVRPRERNPEAMRRLAPTSIPSRGNGWGARGGPAGLPRPRGGTGRDGDRGPARPMSAGGSAGRRTERARRTNRKRRAEDSAARPFRPEGYRAARGPRGGQVRAGLHAAGPSLRGTRSGRRSLGPERRRGGPGRVAEASDRSGGAGAGPSRPPSERAPAHTAAALPPLDFRAAGSRSRKRYVSDQ